jgi:hypothetical protein
MTLSTKHIVLASVVLLVAIALRISFSWTSLELLPATSDEASSVLLAKSISQGSTPLLFTGQPYQFPAESYLMAPFVDWMPRNVIGARYQALLLGVLTTCMMLITAWALLPAGARWPALLLILLPSSYWLQHQSGYTPPQYAMTALLVSLVFLFVSLANKYRQRSLIFLMAGLSGGLLLSNHMLGLSVILGASVVLSMQALNTRNFRTIFAYLAGLAAGALPYILAMMLIEGAYDGVTKSVSSAVAWQHLNAYAFTQTIPGVLGINPVLFTDIYTHLGWGESLRLPFSVLFAAVIALAVWIRSKNYFADITQRSIPDSHPVDMFLIAVLLALVMFVFSARAYPQGYRFLLVIVWCFPFLIGYLYSAGGSVIKRTVTVFVIAYASFNVVASVDMIGKWRQVPDGIKDYAHTPDLEPLLNYLDENNVEHCYASFWIAYRVSFESDEKIDCALPYNERFYTWPIPDKSGFDDKDDVPYILMDTNRSELKPVIFKYHMDKSGFESERTEIGPFTVFNNFRHAGYERDRLLPITDYSISTLLKPGVDIPRMHDGNIGTYWTSDSPQQKWMGLEIKFNRPSMIQRIILRYNGDALHVPKMLWIYTLSNGEWVHVKKAWHKFTQLDHVNGKPEFGGYQKAIWLDDPQPVDAIRLKAAIPDYTIHWSIAEIELGEEITAGAGAD